MSQKVKISVFILLLLITGVFIIQFQAKRIILGLIEANASDRVKVEIGQLRIHPYESSISLQDVMVLVKEKESDNYKKSSIKKIFFDVASLWDFFFGGTLVIEELVCEGGELTIFTKADSEADNANDNTFDLRSIIERIKQDAIRFQIQRIVFSDINVTLINGISHEPTTIKHFNFNAQNLSLNADSLLKRKPLVEFSLAGQTIVFPKGLSFGFDSLFFSTTDNSIQFDKLELLSPANAADNSYQVHSDKVRIAHFDFEALYTKGIIIIDSVMLDHSDVSLAWKLQATEHSKNQGSGITNMPELHIRHLIIDGLSSDIKLRKDTIENSFNIENSYVAMQDFRHKPDSSQTISTGEFDIVVAKYNTFLNNHSTSISFDTVRLQKHRLFLLNFKLHSDDQKTPILQTSIFELKQVDWYMLLVYNNLVANEAIVLNPIVHSVFKPNSKSDPGTNLFVINKLKELLNVNLFTLKNATAYVRLIEKNANLTLRGTYATIRVNEILKSNNVNMALDAIDDFSILNLQVKSPDFSGQADHFNYRQGISRLGSATYQVSNKITFSIHDLKFGKVDWDESQNNLTLDGLGWKSLEVVGMANPNDRITKENDIKSNTLSIRVNTVRGENTRASYQMRGLKVSTLFRQINLDAVALGDTIYVRGVDIVGSKTKLESGPNENTIEAFSLTDQGGAFQGIHFHRITEDSLETYIDRISFRANLPAIAQKKISVNQLKFDNMKTRYSSRDSLEQLRISIENNLLINDIGLIDNKLTLGSLELESGPIDFYHEKKVSKKEDLAVDSTKGNIRKFRMSIDSLFLSDSSRSQRIKNANATRSNGVNTAINPHFTINSTRVWSENGGINLSLSSLQTGLSDSSKQLLANVNSIKFNDIQITNNDLSAHIATGSLNDLVINSLHFNDFRKMIKDNYPSAAIHHLKARLETGDNFIQFDRFDYKPKPSLAIIQGFELRPIKDRQAFLDDHFYQKNFMHTKIDSISIYRFNASRYAEDSVIHIPSIHVASPSLEIGRDKTHPYFADVIKLLPTNAIQKLGVKFKLDSLKFDGGKIKYTEKSRITGQEGSIHFTRLHGLARNVKNIELKESDTLYIRGHARFLDSVNVNIRVRESYRDTLAGFLMTSQVSPFSTSILNQSLIPMVAVEFQSGFVDTISMRATGREYLSLGAMNFFYRDLKVNFLDRNDTSRHSVKNTILKFAANNLVIRSNNSNRVGAIYFERDRQRAVFHYWVKMILSGAATSVGVKSNRKQLKRYKKELEKRKLPPINENW